MVTRSNTIPKASSKSPEQSSTPKTFGRIDLIDEQGELKQTWLLDAQSCILGSDTKSRVQIPELQPSHISVAFGRRNTHIKCLQGTIVIGENNVRESLVDEPTTIRVGQLTLIVFPTSFVPQTPEPEEQTTNFFESQASESLSIASNALEAAIADPSPESSQASQPTTGILQITDELRETLVSSTVVALGKTLEPLQVSLAAIAAQYGNLLQQAQPKRDTLHEEIERRFQQIEQQLPALSSEVEQLNSRLVESFEQTHCSMSEMANDIRSQFISISDRFAQANSTRESNLDQTLALLAGQLGSIQEQLVSISTSNDRSSHPTTDEEDESSDLTNYSLEEAEPEEETGPEDYYSEQAAEVEASQYVDDSSIEDEPSYYSDAPEHHADAQEVEAEYPLDEKLQGYIRSDEDAYDHQSDDQQDYEEQSRESYYDSSSSQAIEELGYQSHDAQDNVRNTELDDLDQEDAQWEPPGASNDTSYKQFSQTEDSVADEYDLSSEEGFEEEPDYESGQSVKTPTASYTPIARRDIDPEESSYSYEVDDQYTSHEEYNRGHENPDEGAGLPSWFTRDEVESEYPEQFERNSSDDEYANEISSVNKFDSAVYRPTLDDSSANENDNGEDAESWNQQAPEFERLSSRHSELHSLHETEVDQDEIESLDDSKDAPTNHLPRKSQPLPRKNVPLTESRRAAATADYGKELAEEISSQDVPEPDENGEELVDDEESVEDYMQRLLARVKGGDTIATPAPTRNAIQPVNTVRAKPLPRKTAPPKVSESFDHRTLSSEEYIPRTAVPENSLNLEAMRSLANETARSAIAKSLSDKPAPKHANFSKLAISVFGFLIGTALLLINGITLNASFLGMICGYLIFLIWGYEATQNVSLTSKRR